MNVKDLTQAALDGKIDQFEAAFKEVMATKTLAAIEAKKAEIGASITIDGEEPSQTEGE